MPRGAAQSVLDSGSQAQPSFCEEKNVQEEIRRARRASLFGFKGATSRNSDGRARDPEESQVGRESVKTKGSQIVKAGIMRRMFAIGDGK
jgi:hypothetical protein